MLKKKVMFKSGSIRILPFIRNTSPCNAPQNDVQSFVLYSDAARKINTMRLGFTRLKVGTFL